MKILDTTIRDGSYAVDFKFSADDVRGLVYQSEKIGIEYIEIGHGMGLDASSAEHGYSLHTDQEYMIAAKDAAMKSKIGFFCIPGIAKLENLQIAKANGTDFIRIGVTVKDFKKAFPYIREGLKQGLQIFVNFMKTYSALPEEFAEAARQVCEEGVECVYIVDSAGSMDANDIGRYIDAIRERTKISMGFHGHNNLGLAVDNSLYCVKKGVEFIDCSFQGLGRSLGNASMEQVIMLLEKRGYSTGYDIPRVLEYGYGGLRNIVKDRLINPLDYVCGYAGFHSSFLKDVYKCCCEKQVDPLRLIIAYSERNRMSMDYNELCRVADNLPRDCEDNPYSFEEYFSEKFYD